MKVFYATVQYFSEHREQYHFSMNALYRSLEISKQAVHQKFNRLQMIKSEQGQLLLLIYDIREDHPTMGIRDMYYKIGNLSMGRDAFETFCKSEGLMSKIAKNWHRTTDSSGVIRFDNLLKDLAIDHNNNKKPHIKLQRKTPVEFENSYICTGQRTDGDKSARELKTQLRNK